MHLRSFQELLFAPRALLVGEASPEGIQRKEHVVYVLGRKLLFTGLLLAWPCLGHRVSPFVEGFRFQATGNRSIWRWRRRAVAVPSPCRPWPLSFARIASPSPVA